MRRGAKYLGKCGYLVSKRVGSVDKGPPLEAHRRPMEMARWLDFERGEGNRARVWRKRMGRRSQSSRNTRPQDHARIHAAALRGDKKVAVKLSREECQGTGEYSG